MKNSEPTAGHFLQELTTPLPSRDINSDTEGREESFRGLGRLDFEQIPAFLDVAQLDIDLLRFGYHLVLQVPAGASAELGDDDVAVAEEVHVEIDMGARL